MTEEDIEARFAAGQENFDEIRRALAAINKKLEILPSLETDIKAAKESSDRAKDLVEAWNALKTGGKFVRWVAPIIGAVAGAWLTVKSGVSHYFK